MSLQPNNLTIIQGDAITLGIPSNSVDLIITHPPYISTDVRRYGGESSLQINASNNEKKMLKLYLKAVKEMYRVLKPSGSLVMANSSRNGFDMKLAAEILLSTDFNLAGTFVQSDPEQGVFRGERIQTESITMWHHFAKSTEMYYDHMEVKRYSNPVWELPFNNLKDPVDTALDKEGFHVLDVMNKEVVSRCIKMFSKTNHVVLDPFGGSALVAVTAAQLGRVGISNDISETQAQAANRRAELTL
jgi:DNA modification methylase